MNLLSYIILLVISIAFVAAVRLAFFSRTGRGSSSCCAKCGSSGACPHVKPKKKCSSEHQ